MTHPMTPSPSPEGDWEIARGVVERHRGNLLKPGSVMRLTEAIAAALTRKGEEEREACARVAEDLNHWMGTIIAAAIRSRKGGKP